MRLAALAACALLSACVFSSEAPLFGADDAAHPFDDGARFMWREAGSDEAPYEVAYQRRGAAYLLAPVRRGERPLEALFVAVNETPQEDYVVQVRMPEDAAARVYAFMWREGETWFIHASPGVLDDAPAGADVRARHCTPAAYGECRLSSREGVIAVYREAVWPHVVAGGASHGDLIEQTPVKRRAGERK